MRRTTDHRRGALAGVLLAPSGRVPALLVVAAVATAMTVSAGAEESRVRAARPLPAVTQMGKGAPHALGTAEMKAGPSASRLAEPWKTEWAEDGKSVVFSWAGRHTLVFKLVEPKEPGAKAVFLCTTEVSVGLFIEVLRASDDAELKGLLPTWKGFVDPRSGPRVWKWDRNRTGVRLGREWLAARPGVDPYPGSASVGYPGLSHPMQYVPPEAAVYFAQLLGCRLPSAAEWRAACESSGAAASPCNLRDRGWQRQQDYVREVLGQRRAIEPGDAGAFQPPESAARRGEEAMAVTDGDDGFLWFAPVGSGSQFEHLIGNVAEYVLDCAGAADAAFCRADRVSAAVVAGFVRENARSLGVIGGSAMSPPELWDGKANGFGKVWPLCAEAARMGAADVGFRLAFTAPRGPSVAGGAWLSSAAP